MTAASTTISISAVLFAIPIAGAVWLNMKAAKKRAADDQRSIQAHCDTKDPLRPPFPSTVKKLLQKCRLAYLSTVDAAAGTSHLSLMRFTYVPNEEVIIMSTNKQTKKYDMLQQQRGVALLVHDFGGGGKSCDGEFSITLNGICSIVEDSTKKEHYRQAHLANNSDYPQFIVGPHIAILCVDVRTARICNIADQVVKWTASDGETERSPADTAAKNAE